MPLPVMVSRFRRQDEAVRQGRREARYGLIPGRLRTPHCGLVFRQKRTDYCREGHLVTEVGLPDAFVLAQLGAGTFERDPTDLEQVRAAREVERRVCVLLDEQHGQTLLLVQAPDEIE